MRPRRVSRILTIAALAAGLAACGSSGDDEAEPATTSEAAPANVGHITFVGDERKLYRLEARANGRLEDVSARLDTLSRKDDDNSIDVSPDGQWLLIDTERFDKECDGHSCLAVVAGDLSSGESVRINGTNGDLLRAAQPGTIGPGGRMIVYPAAPSENSDRYDLFVTTLANGVWGVPVRLTTASPHTFNTNPVISGDSTKVLFTCGSQQYGDSDTSICEVRTDGSGFRQVLSASARPTGVTGEWSYRSPHYEPDGSVVFIATEGSQLWRLAPGAPEPARVSTSDSDESEMCVLPDGRLATSWGGQPGFKDYTLIIRVMSRNATSPVLPAPKTKVIPARLGCST